MAVNNSQLKCSLLYFIASHNNNLLISKQRVRLHRYFLNCREDCREITEERKIFLEGCYGGFNSAHSNSKQPQMSGMKWPNL